MKRRAPILAGFAAHLISLSGNMITLIAVPLYVLDETGSAALTGVAGFAAVLPVVLGGAFGGVIVDRTGYRRASYISDAFGGATILAVPVLHFTVGLPFWALLVLLFLTGLLDTPGQAARSAALPELAEMAGMPLERAVGIGESLERGARLIGAPVAGLLVAVIGPLNTLFVDAATFAVSAVMMAVFVPKSIDDQTRNADGSTLSMSRYWADLRTGVQFLWREPLLRSIALLLVITNSFDIAWSTVILPIYSKAHFDAGAFGFLVGAMGGGALVGSLLFGAVGHRLPRRTVFVIAFLLCGGPRMLIFSIEPGFWFAMATVALAGVAAGALNPIISTVRLERTPPGMRARVGGALGAGAWAGMPLGALIAGVAVEQFGLTGTLRAIGVAYLLIVLVPLVSPAWKSMNDRSPPAEPVPMMH